jgi:selenocysteine lyase/cysteine desulfurase
LGFYRAALSFELLKNDIGYDFIHEREKKNSKKCINLLKEENIKFQQEGLKNSIIIYGHCEMENRANVFTFNIVNNGEIKHHHLISEMLTDIFGIQVRSGCFCAGPFSMILLNLDKKMADNLIPVIGLGMVKDKPGYIRMDLTFYL